MSLSFTRKKKFNLLRKRFRKEAEAGGLQIQGQYRLHIKTGSPEGKSEGEAIMDGWKEGSQDGKWAGRKEGESFTVLDTQ